MPTSTQVLLLAGILLATTVGLPLAPASTEPDPAPWTLETADVQSVLVRVTAEEPGTPVTFDVAVEARTTGEPAYTSAALLDEHLLRWEALMIIQHGPNDPDEPEGRIAEFTHTFHVDDDTEDGWSLLTLTNAPTSQVEVTVTSEGPVTIETLEQEGNTAFLRAEDFQTRGLEAAPAHASERTLEVTVDGHLYANWHVHHAAGVGLKEEAYTLPNGCHVSTTWHMAFLASSGLPEHGCPEGVEPPDVWTHDRPRSDHVSLAMPGTWTFELARATAEMAGGDPLFYADLDLEQLAPIARS